METIDGMPRLMERRLEMKWPSSTEEVKLVIREGLKEIGITENELIDLLSKHGHYSKQ